jgi:hypothetical protein
MGMESYNRFSQESEAVIALEHPEYYVVTIEIDDVLDGEDAATDIVFTVPAAQLPGFIYVLSLNGYTFRSEPAGAL